ncbi:MAG: dihydrodipicolinate synthase family protein [Acidobacteria bacterium]|nr:dihydrodipicolinate synthase family protein [Acidobacteriota bacterium]
METQSGQRRETGIGPGPFGELDTVTVLMPMPFRGGRLDGRAHARNVDYLLGNCFLDEGRRRVIGIGGTSLIHHLDRETLLELVRSTGRQLGAEALFMAGVIPTPPSEARRFIQECLDLKRPPDYFLLMPIPGLFNPEGVEAELSALSEFFEKQGAGRFVLYLRTGRLNAPYARLASRLANIAGIKVGTQPQDVLELLAATPPSKRVLWGVGDRVTAAARFGARGHTSGLTLICPRLCDAINNAYRRRDFQTCADLEQVVAGLEEIRFMEDRIYNYSAVVAASQLGGFQDIDLGEGGPFNAPPPPPILQQIAQCVERLKPYH